MYPFVDSIDGTVCFLKPTTLKKGKQKRTETVTVKAHMPLFQFATISLLSHVFN